MGKPKTIRAAVARIERAKRDLEKMILDRIAATAARLNLSEIVFGLGTHCERDGKEIATPRSIQRLDDVYCDNVCSGGFQGIWSKSTGWN